MPPPSLERDRGRAGDADLAGEVQVMVGLPELLQDVVAGDGRPQVPRPQRQARLRIVGLVGIDRVPRRGQEDDVARHAADAHPADDERLGVQVPVDRPGEQLAELGDVDFVDCELGLGEVDADPGVVVAVRQDVDGLHFGASGTGMMRRRNPVVDARDVKVTGSVAGPCPGHCEGLRGRAPGHPIRPRSPRPRPLFVAESPRGVSGLYY